MAGLVSLVGAGPGDPGLITIKGVERLAGADVVVYDRLASPALLAYAPGGARRIDVGKAPGRAEMTQDEINRLLVEEGKAGRRVVRLKGGDPFVFGRGGEEVEALALAGVPHEVVPGVTSAIAAPAAAGIPVTHRGLSTHVTIVTGHEDPTKGESQTDWDALARAGGTLCVLMGVGRLGAIVDRLVAAGRSPDEPASAVTRGTTAAQQVVRTTLGRLPTAGVESPAVIVIGPVAALGAEWDRRPLAGRRIVVTRAREKASDLRARFEALGAAVTEVPAIAFAEPSDPAALEAAAARLGEYDWVVYTSPTGVERSFPLIGDARRFGTARVAAIGPGTAAALADRFVRADLVPDVYVAEGLAAAFPEGPGRVLILRAEEAREVLPAMLTAKGWDVDVVPVYRTVLGVGEPSAPGAFEAGQIDAITFTSSSTVRNFVALVGDVPRPAVVACIGPMTAQTARDLGWPPTVVASEHSIDGLVAAVASALSGRDE